MLGGGWGIYYRGFLMLGVLTIGGYLMLGVLYVGRGVEYSL